MVSKTKTPPFLWTSGAMDSRWMSQLVLSRARYDTDRVMVDVSRACVKKRIPRIAEPFCSPESSIHSV